MELRLRLAQAEDMLDKIRGYRRNLYGVGVLRKMHISGTGTRPNTRVQAVFDRLQSKIRMAAESYRAARSALLRLEPEGDWAKKLKELHDEDIRGPNREEEQSEGRYIPSWIWLTPGVNTTPEGALPEFGEQLRVEWAKTRARRDRWKEEIELVVEEMRRVLVFLVWKAGKWDDLGNASTFGSEELNEGLRAYAAKQADYQQELAICFARRWYPILQSMPKQPSWLTDIGLLIRSAEECNSSVFH